MSSYLHYSDPIVAPVIYKETVYAIIIQDYKQGSIQNRGINSQLQIRYPMILFKILRLFLALFFCEIPNFITIKVSILMMVVFQTNQIAATILQLLIIQILLVRHMDIIYQVFSVYNVNKIRILN